MFSNDLRRTPDALAAPVMHLSDRHDFSYSRSPVQGIETTLIAQDAIAARAPAVASPIVPASGDWLSVFHSSFNPFKRRGG